MALSTFTLLCSHHQNHLQNFSSSQTETLSPSNTKSLLPLPQPFCFLSLWIWLPWVLHTNGITLYLSFCDWLISLGRMSSRPTYVVAYVRIFSLFKANNIPWYLPRWLSSKESACQCRRHGFDPWVRKIPGQVNGNHSRILAWEIPQTEKPGRLQSTGVSKSRTQLSDWVHMKYSTVCTDYMWFIHSPINTWDTSTFWLLWIMLLWLWVYKHLFKILLSFGVYIQQQNCWVIW